MINKLGKTKSAFYSEIVIFFQGTVASQKLLKIKAKIKLLLKSNLQNFALHIFHKNQYIFARPDFFKFSGPL